MSYTMAEDNNYKKHAKKKKERELFQLRICKKTVYALNPTTDIDYQKQKKKHLPRTSIVF